MSNPRIDAALDVLDREAQHNPDAARLFELLNRDKSYWTMLDICTHFDGCVRARPNLVAILLKHLSDAFPAKDLH